MQNTNMLSLMQYKENKKCNQDRKWGLSGGGGVHNISLPLKTQLYVNNLFGEIDKTFPLAYFFVTIFIFVSRLPIPFSLLYVLQFF